MRKSNNQMVSKNLDFCNTFNIETFENVTNLNHFSMIRQFYNSATTEVPLRSHELIMEYKWLCL